MEDRNDGVVDWNWQDDMPDAVKMGIKLILLNAGVAKEKRFKNLNFSRAPSLADAILTGQARAALDSRGPPPKLQV